MKHTNSQEHSRSNSNAKHLTIRRLILILGLEQLFAAVPERQRFQIDHFQEEHREQQLNSHARLSVRLQLAPLIGDEQCTPA